MNLLNLGRLMKPPRRNSIMFNNSFKKNSMDWKFMDSDKDGVINAIDCRPFNKRKHDDGSLQPKREYYWVKDKKGEWFGAYADKSEAVQRHNSMFPETPARSVRRATRTEVKKFEDEQYNDESDAVEWD